jgi:peptidyl-prolyl cis-trans isomerase C
MTLRFGVIGAFLLMLLGTVALLSGCGSDDGEVLATIGKHKITTEDFNDYYRNVRFPYASAQEEFDMKREFLDSLVIRRLLIQVAYDKGIDKLDEITRLVLANKDKFLLDILYQRNVVDKAKVTEAEVKHFWDNLEYRIRASHIVVTDEDTAKALVERILAGENFGELAFTYSISPDARRNRGDLGYFTWGAMVDEFQQVAFSMEPGEVSPPVKTDFGYHIIKVIDKAPNTTRLPYEQAQVQIEDALMAKKRAEITAEYLETIREKYPVSVDPATLDYVEHKRTQLYPAQLLAGLPTNDFDDTQLDRDERELVLSTWEGGQMTLFEYLTQARRLPADVRPSFTQYDSVATIVFQLKLNDILAFEAARQGLDNDSEFKRRLNLFKELTMADVMRNDSLPLATPPDESKIRMYYDKHPQEFTDPAKVHVYEILVSDEMQANKLVREIKTLEDFKRRAMTLTERPAKRGTNGDLDYIEEEWFPEIFQSAWDTQVGKIGGPVPTMGKYSVFWVDDKIDAALKDFLSQKNRIKNKLQIEESQSAFSNWVEDRKEEVGVKVFEDALWKTVNKDAYAAGDTTGTSNN